MSVEVGQLYYVAELDDSQINPKLDNLTNKILKTGDAAVIASGKQQKSIEQLKIQMASYQRVAETATNPKIISEYNAKVQVLENSIQKLGNQGKEGFDKLGNSIKNSGNVANEAFSAVRKIAYILPGIGLAGLFNLGFEAISKAADELGVFNQKLSLAQLNLNNLNDVNKTAAKQYGEQSTNLRVLYQATQDVSNSEHDRTLAALELKKEFPVLFDNLTTEAILNGKAADAYKVATEAVLENAKAKAALAKISELAAKQLEADFQIQKIQNAESNEAQRSYLSFQKEILAGSPKMSAQQALEFAKIPTSKVFEDGSRGVNGFIDAIHARAKAAVDVQNQNKAMLQSQIEFLTKFAGGDNKLAKALETKPTGSEKEINDILQRRLELIQRIANAVSNVEAKTLTPEQEALTRISDTFDRLKQEIDRFNNDPKNHGLKIPVSIGQSLIGAENAALSNQANLNENKYIQDDIQQKKKLYADYEQYRVKVGDDIANADYADLLRSGKDFQTYLKNIEKSIDQSDNSGAIQQRRTLIEKETKENTERQIVALQRLKEEFASYEQQRQALIKSSQTIEHKLIESGDQQAADLIKRDLQLQLDALDEANFKKLDSYRALFDSVFELTTAQSRKLLQQNYNSAANGLIDNILSNGKTGITLTAYLKIIKQLDDAGLALKNKFPQELQTVGSAIQSVASDFSTLSPAISETIGLLGGVVSGLGSASKAFNDASNQSKGSSAQFADYVSGASSLVGIFIGLSTFLAKKGDAGNAKAQAQQLAIYERQILALEAVNKSIERQIALTDKLYGIDKVQNYINALKQIKDAQAADEAFLSNKIAFVDSTQVAAQGVDFANKLIQEYNQGTANARDKQLADDLIKKLQANGQSPFLSTVSIDELQKLLDSGKIDSETAKIVQDLINLKEEAQQATNALNELFTGESYDSLENSIFSLFENLTTSAKDFGDNFQKIIQTALLNSFKTKYLDSQLQKFYTDLADLTRADNGTLTDVDIAKLKAEYNQIIAQAMQGFKDIQDATGVKFTNGTGASANSLQGSIQASLTEETGSILAGTLKGIQLGIYDLNINFGTFLQVAQENLQVAIKIEVNTKRTADNSDALPDMLTELKGVNSNISGSLFSQLRSSGINNN